MTAFVGLSTRWRIAAAALAALLAATTLFLAAYPSVRASWHGVSQFQDDTFYYLVTAKNFLRLGLFTFDGRNTTNGFQPLWMAAILGVYKAIGPGSALDLQIFAVNVLEKALLGAAVAFSVVTFVQSFRRDLPWAAGYLALSLVLLCPFYFVFDQGMETTLAVLLLLTVTYAFLSDRLLLLGISLALLFLTRLDTAIFVAAPVLAWTVATAPRDNRRWVAFAIFAATFLSYVGFNLITTGHAVPISGAIRSSFPAIRWQGAFFTEPITLARMFGWGSLFQGINIVECAGLVAVGLALTLVARPAPEVRNKLLMLGTVSALLLANLLMFQKWDKTLDPRYLAMPMAMATMFCANALAVAVREARSALATGATAKTQDVLLSPGTRPMLAVLGALPVALIWFLLLAEAGAHLARFGAYAQRTEDPIREIFRDVDQVLPRDAVVAGTDVGALAFWTQRRVVNLDGVINNFEYQEYLRAGALREYLRRQGVTHLATALWDREQTYTGRPIEPMYRTVLDPPAVRGLDYQQHEFFVYSYLYGVYSDKIVLTPADEVYRKFLGKNGIADTAYVVYRFRG